MREKEDRPEPTDVSEVFLNMSMNEFKDFLKKDPRTRVTVTIDIEQSPTAQALMDLMSNIGEQIISFNIRATAEEKKARPNLFMIPGVHLTEK